MSRNLRIGLFLFGLLLVSVSLIALAYAFWPLNTVNEQVPLPPTLFAPP